MKVAVVGGGIAGLSAAWELRADAEVTVFERGRLGGKILTSDFAGRPVDEGPDAFITRSPAAAALCGELGLGDRLVAPRAGRTLVWLDGRLRRLPPGLVLGVPSGFAGLVGGGLLAPAGAARAALDLVLPPSRVGDDASVAELISARFGGAVARRLVEPLLGSIHAAPIDQLSAAATAPAILDAARRSRSLLLALRKASAGSAPAAEAPFATLPGGLGELVGALVHRLVAAGVSMKTAEVASARPTLRGVDVDGEGFDAAVLAVPAPTAARLLGQAAPAGMDGVEMATVVVVTMAVDGLAPPAGVNGILVPPREGRLMTACSFGSSKWPAWSVPGTAVVRISAGRHGDDRAASLGDEQLGSLLAWELSSALGTAVEPREVRVSRWPASFPLYRVGHLGWVARTESVMRRDMPSVALAGSSYRGAGIPACVASGRSAAAGLLERRKPSS